MERPGYFKTISSVFVFVAAFLAVSNFLGGGEGGIAGAAFIAIVVTVAYVLFYGWIVRLPFWKRFFGVASKELPSPERQERTPPTEIPSRTSFPQIAADPGTTASNQELRPSREPRVPVMIADPARTLDPVCDPGPYEVESGSWTKIPLSVLTGHNVTGLLEEADGYDFSYMIIDEDNWALFRQQSEFDVADQADGESTYKIDWFVESDGPWFLVLEAYGKQIIREVEVNLRLNRIGR